MRLAVALLAAILGTGTVAQAFDGSHYVWPDRDQPFSCPFFVTTVGWAVSGAEDYDYTILRIESGSRPAGGEYVYGDLDGFDGKRTIKDMSTGASIVVSIAYHSKNQDALKLRLTNVLGCALESGS